jgi:transcriptional regulator CtsR
MIDAKERLIIEVALRYLDDVGTSEFDVSPYRGMRCRRNC